jgi:hypothetical protein
MPLCIQVNRRLAAILLFLLAPECADSETAASPTHQQGAESNATVSQGTGPTLSHCEKPGLRDRGERCAVQLTTPSGLSSFAWPSAGAITYH